MAAGQGFASHHYHDKAKLREVCARGGRSAQRQGLAHKWTSEEAREAGRKGGAISRGGGRPKKQAE